MITIITQQARMLIEQPVETIAETSHLLIVPCRQA